MVGEAFQIAAAEHDVDGRFKVCVGPFCEQDLEDLSVKVIYDVVVALDASCRLLIPAGDRAAPL
jgi:hypothetical protein